MTTILYLQKLAGDVVNLFESAKNQRVKKHRSMLEQLLATRKDRIIYGWRNMQEKLKPYHKVRICMFRVFILLYHRPILMSSVVFLVLGDEFDRTRFT